MDNSYLNTEVVFSGGVTGTEAEKRRKVEEIDEIEGQEDIAEICIFAKETT